MHKSPEYTHLERATEEWIVAAGQRPADPELAADWDLRQRLLGLDTPELPPALRTRVLQSPPRSGRTAWWLATAATVVLCVGLTVVVQVNQTEPLPQPVSISRADVQELQLALATLEYSARRTSAITGRELIESVRMNRFDELPYAPQLRQWFQPATPTDDS